MAEYKINRLITITNRGLVLGGDIIEGEISPGYFVRLFIEGNTTELIIKSVEFIDVNRERQNAEVGLMIGFIEENTKEYLKTVICETVSIIKR